MDNIIQIKGLKKSYNENLVFESISLNVNRNSIFWIKGVNGSGKSTLMKIVASQIEDYEGDIFYENNNIRNIGNEIHNQIFYLPSSSALYQGLTAFENIKFLKRKLENSNFLLWCWAIFNLNFGFLAKNYVGYTPPTPPKTPWGRNSRGNIRSFNN